MQAVELIESAGRVEPDGNTDSRRAHLRRRFRCQHSPRNTRTCKSPHPEDKLQIYGNRGFRMDCGLVLKVRRNGLSFITNGDKALRIKYPHSGKMSQADVSLGAKVHTIYTLRLQ